MAVPIFEKIPLDIESSWNLQNTQRLRKSCLRLPPRFFLLFFTSSLQEPSISVVDNVPVQRIDIIHTGTGSISSRGRQHTRRLRVDLPSDSEDSCAPTQMLPSNGAVPKVRSR
jgi:hypothetical protein